MTAEAVRTVRVAKPVTNLKVVAPVARPSLFESFKLGYRSAPAASVSARVASSLTPPVTNLVNKFFSPSTSIRVLSGLKIAGSIAYTVGTDLLLWGVIDVVENYYAKRVLRKRVTALVNKSMLGELTEEERASYLELQEILNFRRSPGRVIKDLPYRTWRRVKRVALFDLGYLYALVTSPVWLTANVAYWAYTFAVVAPVSLAAEVMGKDGMGLGIKMMRFAQKTIRFINRVTVGAAWKVMRRASRMRIAGRASMYLAYQGLKYNGSVMNVAKANAYVEVTKISDEDSAKAWGAAFARNLYDLTKNAETDRLGAFYGMQEWTRANVSPQYREAVSNGHKYSTPFYLRDVASAIDAQV